MSDVKGKRLVISAAAGVIVVAIAAVAFWPAEKEPEYHGKKLSEWLEIYATDHEGAFYLSEAEPALASGKEPEVVVAYKAICCIGSNGLPCLLKALRFKPTSWRGKSWRLYSKLPKYLYRESVGKQLLSPNVLLQREGAHWAFWALGDDAAPAVPELVDLAHDPDPHVRREAVDCLSFIGKPAIPYLRLLAYAPDSPVNVFDAFNALLRAEERASIAALATARGEARE